jgi:hypothetical protein
MTEWARHLTEDDEWTVRTALTSIADELERLIPKVDTREYPGLDIALRQSADKYRATLARITRAGGEDRLLAHLRGSSPIVGE